MPLTSKQWDSVLLPFVSFHLFPFISLFLFSPSSLHCQTIRGENASHLLFAIKVDLLCLDIATVSHGSLICLWKWVLQVNDMLHKTLFFEKNNLLAFCPFLPVKTFFLDLHYTVWFYILYLIIFFVSTQRKKIMTFSLCPQSSYLIESCHLSVPHLLPFWRPPVYTILDWDIDYLGCVDEVFKPKEQMIPFCKLIVAPGQDHRILEWFVLEGTFKFI